MKRFRFLIFILAVAFSSTMMGQYPNILVGQTDSPNEPSICINPKNPDEMVAGANNDNYYFSQDGGVTWEEGVLVSSYGVWGDPVVVADTNGDFYFFHLSVPDWPQWLDRIVCQKSVDGGKTWSDGSYMGLNGTKDQDKEWTAVDPANNHMYTSWTQFDNYGSTSSADSSVILFSRSVDAGMTWSPAVRINQVAGDCIDEDNTVEGAVPAVGPQGEIYVSWAGPAGLVFTKSTDGGITWPQSNMYIGEIPGGWDYSIPGISRANGLPVTCCDRSHGPYRGTIYINWSDQRNGEDDTDIWIVKSTDGGNSWSQPKRVNDDPPGRQQFFTWMAIDQSTGYLYTVFYDRRNLSGDLTHVYMAVSRDGGETFHNFPVSESPFNPDASIFFGDYTHIAAHNSIVRPIWTRLHNGQLSIMTALVDSLYVGMVPEKQATAITLDQNFPNPARQVTWFSYKVHEPCKVSLKVYDLYGKEVSVVVDDRNVSTGKYMERFDPLAEGLVPGFYYFSLISGEQSIKKKMIVE
jgi:hypothetical protein